MQGFELNFFLGGLSPIGFQGYYARSLPAGAGRAVLIKAGPGCGKSHLMRALAQRLTAAGHTVRIPSIAQRTPLRWTASFVPPLPLLY